MAVFEKVFHSLSKKKVIIFLILLHFCLIFGVFFTVSFLSSFGIFIDRLECYFRDWGEIFFRFLWSHSRTNSVV